MRTSAGAICSTGEGARDDGSTGAGVAERVAAWASGSAAAGTALDKVSNDGACIDGGSVSAAATGCCGGGGGGTLPATGGFTNSAAFAAGFGSGDAAVASSATLASAASFPRDRRGTVTGAGGGANSASTVATQMAGTAVS